MKSGDKMHMLSVIIPVYNAEKWIEETIDSLVKQSYPCLEIICVDDGSKDRSREIISEYQKQYSNVRLVTQKNSGVCSARNMGIQMAEGEYVAFIDADDWVEADMYEHMIQQMETEESDIIFCEFVRFWPNGKKLYTVEDSFKKLKKNPQDIKYFLRSTESYTEGDLLHTEDIHGSVCRSIFKKRLLQEYNICFHSELRFAEDQIFMLEYLQHCNKISYTKKPYVWYRGWTKPSIYHDFYNNHLNLVRYQIQIIKENQFYSSKEKKQLIGYAECSAYFMIINEIFKFRSDAVKLMQGYSRNKEFTKLLTVYGFLQKYKIKPEKKRIVLLIALKLHAWHLIMKFYPEKKY